MRGVSGYCHPGYGRHRHESCTGVLLHGLGTRVYCACDCHPTPKIENTKFSKAEFAKAFNVWKSDRDHNLAASEKP